MLTGRDFDRSDTADRFGVVIVSRRFARRFWNRTDAIGERVTALLPQSDAFWIPRGTRRPLVDEIRSLQQRVNELRFKYDVSAVAIDELAGGHPL